MYLSEAQPTSWPDVVLYLGLLFAGLVLIAFGVATYVELRKTKIAARQQDDLRQVVHRYEQLAENMLDAQQRTAADVAELRSRTASIEQILRTVE
jgi:hypothetical protein